MQRGCWPRHGRCAALLLLPLAAPAGARRGAASCRCRGVTIYPGDVIGDEQLVERAFIAHTVARASVSRRRARRWSARWRGARCCPASRSPSMPSREPYVVTQGKIAARRVRGWRPDDHDQRHRRCRTAASATSSACATSTAARSSRGRSRRTGRSVWARHDAPACRSRWQSVLARSAPQSRARASRTSSPSRACAPTSSSATAWSSASTAPATACATRRSPSSRCSRCSTAWASTCATPRRARAMSRP